MKTYWTSPESLDPNNKSDLEPEKKANSLFDILETESGSTRRNFLKFFGFSVASVAVLSSCEKPIKKAIPLLIQPEEIKPGQSTYYASAFSDGGEQTGILVKVRDGRPIKIEGNELCPLSKGGTSARIQASLLNLYDENRPTGALAKSTSTNIDELLSSLASQLNNTKDEITIITPTITGPSFKRLQKNCIQKYPNFKFITYDSISYNALRDAWTQYLGKSAIPLYRFDKAEVIVAFNADFIGTWLQPLQFTKQYIQGRKLNNGERILSKHIQFESIFSLTGSNADERYSIAPSQEANYLSKLHNELKALSTNGISTETEESIKQTALELWNHKGKALVVCGTNLVENQLIAIAINELLGSMGSTIDVTQTVNLYAGNDKEFENWLNRAGSKSIGAAILLNVNPIYNYPSADKFANALKSIPITIAISDQHTETTRECEYVFGCHHYLESWNDYQPIEGEFLLSQPTINPFLNTHQAEELIGKLFGFTINWYDFIKETWQTELYAKTSSLSFKSFWQQSLHDGVFTLQQTKNSPKVNSINSAELIRQALLQKNNSNGFELVLYQNIALGDGRWANNPWLQELPDPISKVCWDNYLAVSSFDAKMRGWETGDIVKVNNIEIPVFVQPGQARNTLAIALGYGRLSSGTVASGLGVNGFPMAQLTSGKRNYQNVGLQCVLTESTYELATTQRHHSMEDRPIIRETTLSEYLKDPSAGNHMHAETEKQLVNLYKKHVYNGHHWAMVIDLNSCIGCNACVVACSVENNVPVVGRDEVRRSHEMHWIRIDRYYSGDPENPELVRQPVMCQHCDEAPCENVCPVSATSHSSEGLNQMTYNRCIGTRYCNNNCAYKVRRFNWFDYTGADAIPFNTHDVAGMTVDMKRMVLNPDVTVRAKGVIEKCSLCVQRIQEKKLLAKSESRPLEDGEIVTACQQACPASAIVFGDLNNPESEVVKLMQQERRYHLLEELKTLPSVAYLTKVRNTNNHA